MNELKIKLIELLHDDAFLTSEKIALMLGKNEEEIKRNAEIKKALDAIGFSNVGGEQ